MKTSWQLLMLPLAASTLIALSGCASSGDRYAGGRTAGEKLDDQTLRHNVKDALRQSSVYKLENIDVTAYNRVVQLSGWVDTEDQKTHAVDLARKVNGVQEVVNNIVVKTQVSREPTATDGKGGTADEQSD